MDQDMRRTVKITLTVVTTLVALAGVVALFGFGYRSYQKRAQAQAMAKYYYDLAREH